MSRTAAALAKVRAEIGAIFQDKNNSHLKMNYASLNEINPRINEICAKHGITYDFQMEQAEQFIKIKANVWSSTSMSNEFDVADVLNYSFLLPIEGEARGVSMTQKFGATLTYARRYASQLVFNLSFTDEDDLDDNTHTNQNTANKTTPSKAKTESKPANISAEQYKKFKDYVWGLVPAAEDDWGSLLKTKHKLSNPTDITQFIADDICKTYKIGLYNLAQ
jgi:hypothetical protein